MALDASARNAAVAGVAVLLGAVEFVFVFADPREGWVVRIIASAVFFLLAGAAIGYAHPRGWLLAMLISWGGVAMGGFIILIAFARYGSNAFNASEPPFVTAGIVILPGPLVVTLFGSFL